MSRGLGAVQRAVLAYLGTDPSGRWEGGQNWTRVHRVIAAVAGGGQPSAPLAVSVRRAIRSLAAGGHVEHVPGGHQVRLSPSPQERTAYEEGYRALVGAGKAVSVSPIPHVSQNETLTNR